MNVKALTILAGSAIVVVGFACDDSGLRSPSGTGAGQRSPGVSAGQGGAVGIGGVSGQAGTGGCTDPLRFADPDVDMFVRGAIDLPAGPIHADAVSSLVDLNLIFADVNPFPPCPDAGVCIDYVSPPSADGWITSLAGVECLPQLQSLEVDPFNLDLSPLATLPNLATLWLGPALETNLVPMPRIKTLNLTTDVAHLSALLHAFPSVTTLNLTVNRLPDSPEVRAALSALPSLTVLTIGQCEPTLKTFLNGRGVTVTGC
jgi:hypothetical protein